MKEYERIAGILTDENLTEADLINILAESDTTPEVKIACLFRQIFGVYDIGELEPLKGIQYTVESKRKDRFEGNFYWNIWKAEGRFHGFMEGYFHAQEGKNQLCKIRGKFVRDDYLIGPVRQAELKSKFGANMQVEYFKNPDLFAARFRNFDELRIFLLSNKIERMVAKRPETKQSMHINIWEGATRVAGDSRLKDIFRLGHEACGVSDQELFEILKSFKGYGNKLSRMIMNLVFDIPVIAVDRRVLRSSLHLGLVVPPVGFIEKFAAKYGLIPEDRAGVFDKIASISPPAMLKLTEEKLDGLFRDSPFLSEVDYLLFTYNAGEGWNFRQELQHYRNDEICRTGKCCFDAMGRCNLKNKFEYKVEIKSGINMNTPELSQNI